MYEVGYEEWREAYFNPTTDAVIEPRESFTTYPDLDAAKPTQPLCRPVRRPAEAQYPKAGRFCVPPKVVGVSSPWVVIDNGGTLLAWHCGTPRPEILSTDAISPQLGAGIVTWVAAKGAPPYAGIPNAVRLNTGRHWKWASRYPFTKVVHTQNALYGVQRCPSVCPAPAPRPLRLVETSLRGL
jgi:hypothetical protein